jgi:hypothetical protein
MPQLCEKLAAIKFREWLTLSLEQLNSDTLAGLDGNHLLIVGAFMIWPFLFFRARSWFGMLKVVITLLIFILCISAIFRYEKFRLIFEADDMRYSRDCIHHLELKDLTVIKECLMIEERRLLGVRQLMFLDFLSDAQQLFLELFSSWLTNTFLQLICAAAVVWFIYIWNNRCIEENRMKLTADVISRLAISERSH